MFKILFKRAFSSTPTNANANPALNISSYFHFDMYFPKLPNRFIPMRDKLSKIRPVYNTFLFSSLLIGNFGYGQYLASKNYDSGPYFSAILFGTTKAIAYTFIPYVFPIYAGVQHFRKSNHDYVGQYRINKGHFMLHFVPNGRDYLRDAHKTLVDFKDNNVIEKNVYVQLFMNNGVIKKIK
jgi:hypothetical protein